MDFRPYGYSHHHSNIIPNPNYAPYNSVSAPVEAVLMPHHHQQQLQLEQQLQNGSQTGLSGNAAESSKKRRGRPRKYPEGNGLVLSSNSQGGTEVAGGNGHKVVGEVNGEGSQGRRPRGRPPGSGKKQLDSIGGASGTGFTPHVINILPKEDIVSKMVEFCQEGPRTIMILSTFGAVSNPTLRLRGSTDESGTTCCEGCCDIISLSGPYFHMEYDGNRSNDFELNILLSTSEGKNLGGKVVGKLIAASNVQIIAASFITEQKKSNGSVPPVSSPLPTPLSHISTFRGSATGNGRSIPFDAATDSSEDNGANGSHSLSHVQRTYNNNTIYPMHNSMGWDNSGMVNLHHHNT